MPSRRTFRKSAAVVTAAPLAPRAVFAGLGTSAAQVGVVYDQRHAAARAFGRRATHWATSINGIEGDVTDLWQREISGLWKVKRAAIAGLTERPALFHTQVQALREAAGTGFERQRIRPARIRAALEQLATSGTNPLGDAGTLAKAGR